MEWKEALKKLGIEKMINRNESAEDPNIRFSKFDKCTVNGFQYTNGKLEENYTYKRISHIFEQAYTILEKYGYHIDEDYYRYNGIIPNKDYSFKRGDRSTITIEINPFYSNLFKINQCYGFYSSYEDVDKLDEVIKSAILHNAEKYEDILVLRKFNIDIILE